MTIDEAIAHAREVAVRNREQYKNCPSDRTDIRYQTCEECADEHEQLAEWLEELSRHRVEELFRKTGEKAIRDKAIDDLSIMFISEIKNDSVIPIFVKECETKFTATEVINIFSRTVEQLKAGGKNE